MAKTKTLKYQTKPYQGRSRKETLVSEWTEKVDKSNGMVFTDYKGMTNPQLESLKKEVKKLNGEFVITKNRLMIRSLESKNLSDEEKGLFENPTATLFMYDDVIEPLKALAKTIKEVSLPSIKFGLLENKAISAEDVIKLSKLPGRQQLQAQLVGTLNSPIVGLHRALNWNLQTLVMTLGAIRDKKQA